jgi:hypothetical protein
MTDMRTPAEVFCLAELLSDEMIARGWTTEDVAVRMSATVDDLAKNLLALDLLMCVHDDKLLVGDRMFDGLTQVFGVDPLFFRNIDAVWREHPDRRSPFTPPEVIFGPTSRRATMQVVK